MNAPSRKRRDARWRGTLAVSWGPYGGFYLHPHRVCLGWVAFTVLPHVEVEDLMEAYIGYHQADEAAHA